MTKSNVFKDDVLHDRVAIITGGSSGLGFGMASAYQTLGAHVVLIGRDAEKLAHAC